MQEYFNTEQLITTYTIYEPNHKMGVCTGKKETVVSGSWSSLPMLLVHQYEM